MKDFNSDAHVEEWMDENGGIDALRRAIDRGAFAGQNLKLACAWLNLHDRKQKEQLAQAEQALLERSVAAAENSAKSSHQAARWAMWATIVALVAIVVAVVQQLRSP